jgi:di/tricarboxylate transporter
VKQKFTFVFGQCCSKIYKSELHWILLINLIRNFQQSNNMEFFLQISLVISPCLILFLCLLCCILCCMDEGSERMEAETHLPLIEIAEDQKVSNSGKVWLVSLVKIFSLFHLFSFLILHMSIVPQKCLKHCFFVIWIFLEIWAAFKNLRTTASRTLFVSY